MKPLFAIAVGLVLVGWTSRISADDSKKKDDVMTKLLGKWEVTKADGDQLVGATITFEKDGKFNINLNGMDIEGTYKIDEKGKLVTSIGDNSDTDTFKKLTADDMELENNDHKVTILKRKK